MSKVLTVGATALLGCILCATPLSLRLSPEGKVSLFRDSASAVDAGVNRRAHRRALGSAITNTTTAVRLAVTIQSTSGSVTTDSGGISDSLTRRGGHAEAEAHQHPGSLT